jgi:hypothetical protein
VGRVPGILKDPDRQTAPHHAICKKLKRNPNIRHRLIVFARWSGAVFFGSYTPLKVTISWDDDTLLKNQVLGKKIWLVYHFSL